VIKVCHVDHLACALYGIWHQYNAVISAWLEGKKVKVGFLYSTAYTMTRPARFTISEVAVDWQEPMVLQRKLRP